MKRLLLVSAVSAALAAPGLALAQAAAVPTLDKVLEASGISVSGYIDTAYTHADHDIQAGIVGSGGIPPRVLDNQNNSFGLHQFGLTVAKQPKEGFGGVLNLTAGTDGQVIHSYPESLAATNSSMFDVTQAYAQYAGGPLTVMMGKYTTMHGTEVIASTGNTNFSRSILFGAVPFTHTGVRVSYAASDTVTLMAGVNNGWDQVTDPNRGKTVELGATLTPVKPLTIVLSAMSGSEPVNIAAPTITGARTSLNAVGTYTATDALSFGLEYLSVTQDNFTSLVGAGTIKAKYSGEALYVTYMFNPKWRGVLRTEQFSDKDGYHFGVADTKYSETTLTLAYLPSPSFELRGEVRSDSADKALYVTTGAAPSKSFTTLALEALYKF
jgi:hypothetical protein